MSLDTAVSPANVASAALIALETAERHLMPRGGHSRLFVAIQAMRETRSFLAFESEQGRARLTAAFRILHEVESNADALGQLPAGSLIHKGLNLAIHLSQAALLGETPGVSSALEECRQIVLLAERAA